MSSWTLLHVVFRTLYSLGARVYVFSDTSAWGILRLVHFRAIFWFTSFQK